MDEKLTTTIAKIKNLAQQNPEFDQAMRKLFGGTVSAFSVPSDTTSNSQLDEIYEYCISKILKEQASDFYKNLPSIFVDQKKVLMEDYYRMEKFHRQNNFGDFCLAIYQQIECITNVLCKSKDLNEICEKFWGYPAYVKDLKEKTTYQNRAFNESGSDSYCIANLLFMSNAAEKSRHPIQSLTANDKMRVVVYFVGYLTQMKSSDYESFVSFTNLLRDIYQCRNMNHRGNTLTEWEQSIINRVSISKTLYYYKFMGVLSQYLDFIEKGVPRLQELKAYADTLASRKIAISLKIVGKLDEIPH